jgi:hypothetical protein
MQHLQLREQVETILAYVHQCVTTRVPVLRASTVVGRLTGIKSLFRENLLEATAFDHPSVRGVKVAINLEERKRDPYNQHSNQKLPMTLGMVLFVGEKARLTNDPNKIMAATAILLAFMCLLRVSEYVAGARDEEDECCHALVTEDVWFEVARLSGIGSEMVCACDVNADMWSRVVLVKFTLRDAKNDQYRVGSTFWYRNRPGLANCSVNIVQSIFEWAIYARLRPADFFFSHNRYAANVRLNKGMVERPIWDCARLFGLDSKRYGTHSPRVGGATTLRAGDAPPGTVQDAGRWRSARSCLTYQDSSLQEFDRMLTILQDASVYTTHDLMLLESHYRQTEVQAVPVGRGNSRW